MSVFPGLGRIEAEHQEVYRQEKSALQDLDNIPRIAARESRSMYR